MAEVKAGHVRGFHGRGARPPAQRGERIGFLRWAVAAAALALSSACFSPEAYTEHMCRSCTSECPEGLTCHEGRCLPVCNPGCVGDYHCDGDACVRTDGELCPSSSVSLALCIGEDNDVVAVSGGGVSSDTPWVVLDSRLPEGVSFDAATGTLSGSPTRVEPGTITVRHGEPGSEELSVAVATQFCPQIEATSITWCRGKDETAPLVASAAGDYEWQVGPAELGLEVQGGVLAGNIAESGTHRVQIELWMGSRRVRVEELELNVVACVDSPPVDGSPLDITTLAALPNACEGAVYGARFEATGGQPPYHWTLETELAGVVLDAQSGRLTGEPRASGDFELTVSVEDQAGNHDSISAALHVVSVSEECVTPVDTTGGEGCAVGETPPCPRDLLRIVSTDLGVACVGENFSARLAATGGGGDFDWGLSNAAMYPAPSGLRLERSGELHGVPGADAVGRHRVRVFVGSTLVDTPVYGTVELEIASCDGLVFQTDEAGASRLFLASTSTGAVSELSEGVLAAGEGVHSFALSADGVHAAFDVADANGLSRLYWVDLTTGEATLPAFFPALPGGASIIDYRWSLDGGELAATFRAGDEVFLGIAPAAGGVGWSIDISGPYLSSLLWAGDRICYVAIPLNTTYSGVLCHVVTPDGIDNQASQAGIFDPIELRTDLLISSDEGYLAILSDGIRAQYIIPDAQASGVAHFDQVFSPGLHRAAGPSPDDASLFQVVTSRGAPRNPLVLAPLAPCDKVDAWSLDERSIACRSGESLAIHRLGADGALASSVTVQDSAGYPSGEFRRLWAPGGQWYAYDANGELRVVSVDATPPRSRLIAEGVQAAYAGLGTDASGAHLYYHHGSELEVIDTAANFAVRNLNAGVLLPDPAGCTELQLEDGPGLWCGAQSTRSFFFPAPEAPRVAFVDRQNQLYVADLVAAASAATTSAAAAAATTPRLIQASNVKCMMDSGETACDNFVQWVPRREP